MEYYDLRHNCIEDLINVYNDLVFFRTFRYVINIFYSHHDLVNIQFGYKEFVLDYLYVMIECVYDDNC